MNTDIIILIVFALILLIGLRMFIPFLFAKYNAVNQQQTEIDLLWGWVKLVLWQPNEGVVILRNKNVLFTDEQGKGGIKYIFPIRGEELRAKVLLTTRLLTWEDDKILTRESLQIHMRVAVWWNVSDILKYVFDIDRPAQFNETRSEINLLKSSEAWLKTLTEGTIRVLASKASATQLITTATTGYLNVHHNGDGNQVDTAASVQSISETIALQLREELNRKLKSYGIGVNRVEIQAIRLSAEVQQAIDNVWLAHLKPVQTEQEARARKIELEALASVLGTDAVALNELLKNFEGSNFSFFQPPAFLQTMFGMINTKTQKMQNPNSSPSLPGGKEKNMIEDK
ncbi:MAG TPA: SPFH domain-containing protein [Parafilimonas sp.]|nr:SPFH domain-containing protein [Parafilimonas sp.]